MPDSARQQLYKIGREGQEKYTYFLLAAAGAAIAFAVTQSQTATLTLSKIPLALAILSWAFSFYAGCRQTTEASNIIQQNYDLLRVQDGLHPEFPNNPAVVAAIELRSGKCRQNGSVGSSPIQVACRRCYFLCSLARN